MCNSVGWLQLLNDLNTTVEYVLGYVQLLIVHTPRKHYSLQEVMYCTVQVDSSEFILI